MQASFDLKKSPDRVAIAGFAMLATLIVGGLSGYAVKSLTTSAPLTAPVVTASTAGVAAPASDRGFANRALRLELQDQKGQTESIAASGAQHISPSMYEQGGRPAAVYSRS